ncbi:MAG: paraquat-inducible protein A [Magnetococcales bacterium]|nr:paraquat-inducible protein A [Magnetococcales bacterium]
MHAPIHNRLISCPECDLSQWLPTPTSRTRALRCRRCNMVLIHFHPQGVERVLAMTLASLILLGMAVVLPFMTLELNGQTREITLGTGVITLFHEEAWGLAALVLLTSMVAPLLYHAGLLYVLGPLWLGRIPRGAAHIWRWVLALGPWSMTEVYMLGVLVAFVKLAQMATILPGLALYCLAASMLAMMVTRIFLDPDLLWSRLPQDQGNHFPERCPQCGLGQESCQKHCRRCGASLGRRKPESLSRTWALVMTAGILYIPANLLPIMTVVRLGHEQSDTILSGVAHLVESGMWPLALVVFVASILVPILKLLVLAGLLLSIQHGWGRRRHERNHLYRLIEVIGRWSMIDIFMISILVAIVDLGEVATIHPGQGALYFAAVVVITLFAARTFDPRLIWQEEREK